MQQGPVAQIRQTVLPAGRIGTRDLVVLTVSWSASGLALCESNAISIVEANRRFPRFRGQCTRPTFFEDIRSKIREVKADIVAITTQHEPSSNTFLHSEYLPMALGDMGFTRVQFDPYKFSDSKGSTLRLSVYSYNDLQVKAVASKHQFRLVSGGAIVSYLQVQEKEMVFIAVQTAELSPLYTDNGNNIVDHDSLRAANTATELIQLIASTVNARNSVNWWLMGDFGSSVAVPGWDANMIIESIRQHGTAEWVVFDTMSIVRQFPTLSILQEGSGDIGRPTFGPVFPLSRKRGSECVGAQMSSACFLPLEDRIGWPSRIFYTGNVTCSQYNRLNSGSIVDSDSDLIYAVFKVK